MDVMSHKSNRIDNPRALLGAIRLLNSADLLTKEDKARAIRLRRDDPIFEWAYEEALKNLGHEEVKL